jgi:hypothetical protein
MVLVWVAAPCRIQEEESLADRRAGVNPEEGSRTDWDYDRLEDCHGLSPFFC